jgi:hypothetical protein
LNRVNGATLVSSSSKETIINHIVPILSVISKKKGDIAYKPVKSFLQQFGTACKTKRMTAENKEKNPVLYHLTGLLLAQYDTNEIRP